MRKTTIKDIAQAAKISPSAVSLVMNNRPGVSQKTRSMVLRIAEALNYIPNNAARSLVIKHSHTIGLIISDITDPFYPELAKGIEEKANSRGYSIILCNTGGRIDNEYQCIINLMSRRVDGIILSTVLCDDHNLDILMEDEFPFILVNKILMNHVQSDQIDHVVVDNYAGGYKAIEHLYKIGHDRIAILTGVPKSSTIIARTEGAYDAIRDYGIKFNEKFKIRCDYSMQKAFNAAKKLLRYKTYPTAFFAEDDNMALGVREAVLSLGLRIPEDVAIIGFDDINISSLAGIELTTVSHKKYAMGTIATGILVDKIEGKMPRMVNKVVLDAELIARKTCGYHLNGYVR